MSSDNFCSLLELFNLFKHQETKYGVKVVQVQNITEVQAFLEIIKAFTWVTCLCHLAHRVPVAT